MSILKLFVTLSGNKREGFAISSVTSRKFGIIGYPLKHTLSPLMHNNNFKRLGVNATYVPYEIFPDDFQKQALTLKSMFDGFNVTVPFKEEIIPFLDEVSVDSKSIGAVNTVIVKNNKWYGLNTDWIGLSDSFEKDYYATFDKKNIMIFGAGGSARACVYAAVKKGAKSVTIVNRTFEKAKNIADSFSTERCSVKAIGANDKELKESVAKSDIFINSTSIGLNKSDIHYFDFSDTKKDAFVYDLIYSNHTDFLTKASSKGLHTGNGRGMLVRQGAYSFQEWTGIAPDISAMFKDIS